MARYALRTTLVDAMLRYRIAHHREVRMAVEDVTAGREGLTRMLERARRATRRRLRDQIEREVIRAALSVGAGQGRETIARVVRRAGYGVGGSTVRRILMRRGLWPSPEMGGRGHGRTCKTRPTLHGFAHCVGRNSVRKGDDR